MEEEISQAEPEIYLEVVMDEIGDIVRIIVDYNSLLFSPYDTDELRNGFILAAARRYNIEKAVKPFCTGAAWQRAKIGADL